MLASCPASILNHFSTLLGIPFRLGLKSSRSSGNCGNSPGVSAGRRLRRRRSARSAFAPTRAPSLACL
jgi:hypothetical protein